MRAGLGISGRNVVRQSSGTLGESPLIWVPLVLRASFSALGRAADPCWSDALATKSEPGPEARTRSRTADPRAADPSAPDRRPGPQDPHDPRAATSKHSLTTHNDRRIDRTVLDSVRDRSVLDRMHRPPTLGGGMQSHMG